MNFSLSLLSDWLLVLEEDRVLPDVGAEVHLDELVGDADDVDDEADEGGDAEDVRQAPALLRLHQQRLPGGVVLPRHHALLSGRLPPGAGGPNLLHWRVVRKQLKMRNITTLLIIQGGRSVSTVAPDLR